MNQNQGELFEALLLQAINLPLSGSDAERKIQWCGPGHSLGMAKQSSGAIELFLRGSELIPRSSLVKRHLRYDKWSRETGTELTANRLVFPRDEYFVAATAFLVEELLRHGAAVNLAEGFAKSEPLIERFLKKVSLSEEEILGLLGELRLLEVCLLQASSEADKARSVGAWVGAERSARDFEFRGCSVEVKATRRDTSTHHINSLWQVNPKTDQSGKPIEQLYLLSIGLVPGTDGVGLTVSSQVDKILEHLGPHDPQPRTTLQELFLEKLKAYGGSPESGYDHLEMKSWAPYNSPWVTRFSRVYDLCDPTIQILRPSDVRGRGHVPAESVSFSICLPDQMPGGTNPTTDLLGFGRSLITSRLKATRVN